MTIFVPLPRCYGLVCLTDSWWALLTRGYAWPHGNRQGVTIGLAQKQIFRSGLVQVKASFPQCSISRLLSRASLLLCSHQQNIPICDGRGKKHSCEWDPQLGSEMCALSAVCGNCTSFLQTLSRLGSTASSRDSLTIPKQTVSQQVGSKAIPWLVLVCPESIDCLRLTNL